MVARRIRGPSVPPRPRCSNPGSHTVYSITDASIDPVGNVSVANNWNVAEAVIDEEPARPTSTWVGGSGIVVIYGIATPVQMPLVGQVRSN